ncbi:hypothetical protein VTN31DRAFT_3852 [Thermomyces dupontii]|uniref:uncharacterized protein n=1 Tax=Talaromyces thermophilus TaxID=28565 RepID=UPI0037434108
MHPTVVGTPLRATVIGARIAPAPFLYAGPTSVCVRHQLNTTAVSRRYQSTYQPRPHNVTRFVPCIGASRISLSVGLPGQTVAVTMRKSFGNSMRRNSTASTSQSQEPTTLDWNTFFKLRASRRRYSLVSSILTSIASTAVGVQILSTQDLDALGAQVMGLDPFVVLGLATAACGAVGWLAGPFMGNAIWGLIYRRYRRGVAIKEKEFFDRIKRFRVDPSSNSIANPVPDYYGEKIGSVQGYRQWLKDQRAYNRKRSRFIL